jgi:hypothetical protein
MGDIPPSPTIYVNNLNEKTKKDGASHRASANLDHLPHRPREAGINPNRDLVPLPRRRCPRAHPTRLLRESPHD